MRNLLVIPLLAALIATAIPADAQQWELVWSDEFDTPGAPDPSKWTYDIGGHGWGNQELQYYTDRLENARVEDGVLIIEAREESFGGNDYTSARLVTRGLAAWQYGRIEARMKMPIGQGIWPAFWMLPTDSPYGGWPAGGEIDIMEYLGHVPNQVHGTIHSGGGELGHRFTGDDYVLQSGTFADDFHVFALEWEPRQMRWYVDGELYLTQVSWSSIGGPYPAPFDHPFHILMNVAVGGQWPGYPDETTTFPQQMLVDYVRVYQDTTAAPTVALEAPEDGLVIGAGDTLEIRASASSTGEITEVAFLQDGGVLGVATSAPYEISIGGLVDGCYVLRARATNAAGYVTTGDSVQVTVGGGCPPGSTAPYLMVPARIPGTIEAEYYDLGGSGVAYFDLSATNDGNGIRPNEGVDIRRSRDEGGGHDVTEPRAREWLQYTVDVEETGSYRILARVAVGSGGTVRLSLDDVDLLGDVSFPATGGNATYGNAILGTAEFPAGRHTLRVEMRSAGFSLNRLRFDRVSGTSSERDPPGPTLELSISPNPARSRVEAHVTLPTSTRAEVALYDVTGRQVGERVSGWMHAGTHDIALDGSGLAPGFYVCVLKTSDGIVSRPLIIVN